MFRNDACFSDNDFTKIDALFVGSKQDATDKIGRRGLGFRAVYNFTNFPSILSGNTVLIQVLIDS